jgi:hypothetical protein
VLRANSLPRTFQLRSEGSGCGSVGVRENEDIFLGEVCGGGKVGIEKREMDVHLDQFRTRG